MANDAGQDLQRHGTGLGSGSVDHATGIFESQDAEASIYLELALQAFDVPGEALQVLFHREAAQVAILAGIHRLLLWH